MRQIRKSIIASAVLPVLLFLGLPLRAQESRPEPAREAVQYESDQEPPPDIPEEEPHQAPQTTGSNLEVRTETTGNIFPADGFVGIGTTTPVELLQVQGIMRHLGTVDGYGNLAPITGNVVHDVVLTNPKDSTGAATSTVVLYRAHTTGENTSPATTKFEAYSQGFYTPPSINFDSRFSYHKPQHYHYRAYSTSESKETFWIKPATNSSVQSGTRADMFLSGVLGIGTATGTNQNVLNIARDQDQITALRISNAGSTVTGAANTNTSVGLRLGEAATEKAAIVSLGSLNTVAAGGPNALQIWNYATGAMLFATSNVERARIDGSGNVGIGTAAPGAKLDVNGTTQLSGNVNVGKTGALAILNVAGDIVTTGSITGAKVFNAVYQDVAEWVPATADLTPGTVVVLNASKSNEVMASHGAYDTSVAGVVSDHPGLLLGVGAANKEMVATTGRVKVRVDARQSPVRVGDLLVTSEVPGTAMRSEPMDLNGRKFHQPGTIIGKALEPLEGGLGEILVLLSMQ